MTKMVRLADMNAEQLDAVMSEENLNRVHEIMQSISRENSIAFHKGALIETIVTSINSETGYGESLRVIE
jgi:hypothetical protein